MEVVKETKDYTIFKKRSGRYGVRRKNGAWVNGSDKVEILVGEGLVKAAVPKKEEPAAEAPAEEAPADEAPAAE